MDLASRLEARNIPQLKAPTTATNKPKPAASGFQPVTVVQQPVKLTRHLILVFAGISATVSLVISGITHLILG